jgi:hypothetical protein
MIKLSPPLTILGDAFPSRLRSFVKAILDLLHTIPTRHEEARHNERIRLLSGFLKFLARLLPQPLVPRLATLLVRPVKVLGGAQDFPVQTQGLAAPRAEGQVLAGRQSARTRGDPNFGRHRQSQTRESLDVWTADKERSAGTIVW